MAIFMARCWQQARHTTLIPQLRSRDSISPPVRGRHQRDGFAIQIIKLLLTHGADPRLKNNMGKTPIDYAKNSIIKDLLRKHDAK